MTIKRKKKMHNEKETGWLAPAELVTVFTMPNREEVESLLKSGKELPDLQKRRITVDEICEIRALRRVPTLTTSEQEDRIELGKRQAEKEIRSNLLSSPQLLESFAEIVRPQFQLLIETSLSRLRPNTLRTKFRLSDKEQQLTIENILEGFSSFSAFASETFNLAISSRKWSKTEEQSLISFWNMMASTFPLNESMKIAWDFGIQELTNRNASDELLLKHILMTEERVSLEVLKQTVTRKAEVFGVSDERVINNTWLFLIGLLEIAGDQKKPDILIDKLLISTRDNKPLEMCALVCPRWVYFANNDFGVIPHLGDHIEKETNTLYSGLSERLNWKVMSSVSSLAAEHGFSIHTRFLLEDMDIWFIEGKERNGIEALSAIEFLENAQDVGPGSISVEDVISSKLSMINFEREVTKILDHFVSVIWDGKSPIFSALHRDSLQRIIDDHKVRIKQKQILRKHRLTHTRHDNGNSEELIARQALLPLARDMIALPILMGCFDGIITSTKNSQIPEWLDIAYSTTHQKGWICAVQYMRTRIELSK